MWERLTRAVLCILKYCSIYLVALRRVRTPGIVWYLQSIQHLKYASIILWNHLKEYNLAFLYWTKWEQQKKSKKKSFQCDGVLPSLKNMKRCYIVFYSSESYFQIHRSFSFHEYLNRLLPKYRSHSAGTALGYL